LQDLGPVLGGDYVQLNDGTQLRRVHGSGEVVVTAANADLGGGVTASFEHVDVSLNPTFTARVTAAEVAHTSLQTSHNSLQTANTDNQARLTTLEAVSSQAAVTRPVLPAGSIELLTADSLMKRVLGSDGIQTQDTFHITSDGTTPYLAIKLDSGTLGRLTTLETKIDVQEVLSATSTQNDAIQLAMIQSLAARLDVLDGGTAGGLILETGTEGPLQTGDSNSVFQTYNTSFGNVNTTIHDITFTKAFSSPPRMYVGQSSANSGGHHTLMRIFVGAVTTSGAQILIGETGGSNHVYFDWAAIQS